MYFSSKKFLQNIICKCGCCFFILVLYFNVTAGNANAQTPVKVVFLDFANNTIYSDFQVDEVMDELLLERLFEANKFIIMERYNDEETKNAEGKINFTSEHLFDSVEKKDFSAIFQASENDISTKDKGDYIDVEYTRIIGKKNNAEYLLYGSIDDLYVKSGFMILPLKYFVLSNTSQSLEAVVTVKIIKASTGEVVWTKQEKAASKNSVNKALGVTLGTKGFSSDLFYEALDKISKKIVKDLAKDLKNGELVLTAKD